MYFWSKFESFTTITDFFLKKKPLSFYITGDELHFVRNTQQLELCPGCAKYHLISYHDAVSEATWKKKLWKVYMTVMILEFFLIFYFRGQQKSCVFPILSVSS